MYAVIKTGGKQYRVAKDAVLEVERVERALHARERAALLIEAISRY